MLNASAGVQRVLGRARRPQETRASSLEPGLARSRAAVHGLQRGVRSVIAASRLVPHRARSIDVHEVVAVRSGRPLLARLGHDRALVAAVAGVLVGAAAVSATIGHPSGPTGGTNGAGTGPRIAVGGTVGAPAGTGQTGNVQLGQADPTITPQSDFATIDLTTHAPVSAPVGVAGPFIDDGTLVKPIAVDTSVPDGSALVRTYTVKPGDTAVGVAIKFHVSKMTVWWANDLKSNTDLHVGQVLRIPPVTGLIVRVTATDTLGGLAARFNVDSADILATNGISDPNLVVGQTLVVPGAKGLASLPQTPTTRPVQRPPINRPSNSGGGSNVTPPSTYAGGKFMWPVVGGGNYISQYFHYGHYAIDIAADYGSTVRAAADGIVTYAGWKNNGGGYQVWVAHGSGLFTTYNHMSAVTVGVGQHVAAGAQVGRIGQSGNATGPHLHFEVWRGPIWDSGQRVNPLAYF